MIPLWLLITLVVGLSAAGTFGLVYLVRRLQSDRIVIPGTGDIEGYYITVIGALYAIFVAFMIFVVWTRFYESMETVDQEANALANLYRMAAALPEPYRSQIRSECVNYTNTMVKYEWPAMARGEDSLQGWSAVNRMWDTFNRIGPAQIPDSVRRDHLMESWINLSNLRRLRILQSRTTLPGILYVVLFFGAFTTIGFAAVFTTRDFWPHAIKAVVLAAMISLMLFTVWALDRPFMGQVHVGPEAFERSIRVLQAHP